MKSHFQVNLRRLHIVAATNPTIQFLIDAGHSEKRSIRFDRLQGQVFFTARLGTHFINIDFV